MSPAQVDRGPTIERVGGVSVPEPVRRHLPLDPGPFRCPEHDALDRSWMQMATAAARRKHRRLGRPTPEAFELAPDRSRQQHHPRLATLAEDCHLAGVVAHLQITPLERGELGEGRLPDT